MPLAPVNDINYGPHYGEDEVRASAAARYDRAFYPEGMARQLAALLSDGDRTAELAALSVPILVVHGRADTLVPLANGEATARAIPGAELVVFDEMGHDLPDALVADIAEAMAKLATRA